MLSQLLTPGVLLELGLLAVACVALLLGLLKVDGGRSHFVATRLLVWLMVLASVLPVTIDQLTRGRIADVSGADAQLGSLGQQTSRGMQIALVIVAVLVLREAARAGARGPSGLYAVFFIGWFVTVLSSINNGWSPKLLGWLMPLVVLALFASARAGAPLLVELRRVLLAVVVVSLGMYFFVPSVATLSGTRSGVIDARLAGVFSHPNGMGAAAAVALLLSIATSKGLYRSVTIALAGVTLVLSDSRTALVAVAVCVPILLVAPGTTGARTSGQTRRLAVILGSLAGGFLLVQGLLTNSTDVASANGRTLVWDYVLQEWHTQPFFGAGPDGWTSARMIAAVPQYAGQAHNQFFETLYLFGLFGVVSMVLLIAVGLVRAWRFWLVGNALPLALLACLLVTGFSESPLKFDVSGLSAEGAIGLVVFAMVQMSQRKVTDAPTETEPLTLDRWAAELTDAARH